MGYPSYRDDSVRELPEHATGNVVMAMRIVREFGDRTPEAGELMTRYGMSRATAYRWKRAFVLGRGVR